MEKRKDATDFKMHGKSIKIEQNVRIEYFFRKKS